MFRIYACVPLGAIPCVVTQIILFVRRMENTGKYLLKATQVLYNGLYSTIEVCILKHLI